MNKIIQKSLLLLFITSIGYSQSRENRVNGTFKQASEKIKKAVGWKFNKETGKWVDNLNYIDNQKDKTFWISHLPQNFKWIQIRTIEKEGELLYVFMYEKQSGKYKYPSIRKGWEKELKTSFFIITKEDYELLKKHSSIKAVEKKEFTLKSKIHGFMTDRYKILKGEHLYNEENLLAKINNAFQKSYNSDLCLKINFQNDNGKDIVRFRLPEWCSEFNKSFEKAYFEIDKTDFNLLFNLL